MAADVVLGVIRSLWVAPLPSFVGVACALVLLATALIALMRAIDRIDERRRVGERRFEGGRESGPERGS